MEEYKCIKAFSLPLCDGDGFETDKWKVIEVGTVWYTPEEKEYRFIGGEVRLESDDFGWIEISNKTFEKHFEIVQLG